MSKKSKQSRKPKRGKHKARQTPGPGGPREGSGRPALAPETADLGVRVPVILMMRIDAYQEEHEFPSRSAAVRELLESGLRGL